jgi:DNA-binding MarR family transcriptional regulator
MTDGFNEGKLADQILHLGRVAYTAGAQHGLSPAQWLCLRYLSRANRFSRTVSGFADFHATTRGTASLTVSDLVERGLLRRRRSRLDGRSRRLDLTDEARELLSGSVIELEAAIKQLPRTQRTALAATLDRLMSEVGEALGAGTFGTCGRCAYFATGVGSARTAAESFCNRFGEPLEPEDVEAICLTAKRPTKPAL